MGVVSLCRYNLIKEVLLLPVTAIVIAVVLTLVIAVPVGFVNVVAAKERIMKACEEAGVPWICNRGRKGGSNVAAAICNAILYRL